MPVFTQGLLSLCSGLRQSFLLCLSGVWHRSFSLSPDPLPPNPVILLAQDAQPPLSKVSASSQRKGVLDRSAACGPPEQRPGLPFGRALQSAQAILSSAPGPTMGAVIFWKRMFAGDVSSASPVPFCSPPGPCPPIGLPIHNLLFSVAFSRMYIFLRSFFLSQFL